METTLTQQCLHCGTPSSYGDFCCGACEVLHTRTGPLPVLPTAKNPFSYLDQENFKELFLHKENSEFEYIFFAEGLHCSSCVHLLEKLPTFYEGVKEARVNFAQSTVSINLHPGASLAQVAFVIQELGYRPSLISPHDNLAERYKAENRAFLKRIAVAGFCAGNTMLFVIPVYAGLTGIWATVFNWLSFALFLPILFYSAIPFYRGAWNSLKFQVINVDLPIAIAMLSGFFLSTYNLIVGSDVIYFDSTASFMFFILSARYLLKRVQQNYLSPARLRSFFQAEKYLKVIGTHKVSIPWSSTQVGDVLEIQQNQNLPSDCELLSPQTSLDMSLFNGESLPKTFSQGMTLFAGTKVLDPHTLVRVQVPFNESRLGQLFQQLDQGALEKSQFIALTDRLAQKLIIVVFSIAILFFIGYASIDATEAMHRSLALIVLACPCALAFGSPLTLGMALKKAQKSGILLKDATSLEKVLRIKNIFFDKTGTLTDGNLSLSDAEPQQIPENLRRIILSLESGSYHPVAFALRKAWGNSENLLPVTEFTEILGSGVRGIINGQSYELRHLAESTHEDENAIELLENGHSRCRLYFRDALRPDSPEAIAQLKKLGYNCFLLSGDKKIRVQKAAQACGIPAAQAHGELFPEDKKEILSRYKETCMIGDGANDSLSLLSADVGIAVKGSVDLSLNSADVYFTRGGLSPLFDLLKLSQKARQVLVRNLTISLIYNTVGGVLALLGFINPMMAAILMPISSFIIILSSVWGFR